MAFKSLSSERVENITRAQLKEFSDTRNSQSPLRPLIGLEINVEFKDNEPIIAFTPYERDGKRDESYKFVEIKTDKGWLPLNCFATKQFIDHTDINSPKSASNTALGKFGETPLVLFDTIKDLGKAQKYQVVTSSYIGRTDTGRLYPATSYVLNKK